MRVVEILKEFKINSKELQFIVSISEVKSFCSNEKVAKLVGLTPQYSAKVLKRLEEVGFIENVSVHPLRRDWVLTPKGLTVLEQFKVIKK